MPLNLSIIGVLSRRFRIIIYDLFKAMLMPPGQCDDFEFKSCHTMFCRSRLLAARERWPRIRAATFRRYSVIAVSRLARAIHAVFRQAIFR